MSTSRPTRRPAATGSAPRALWLAPIGPSRRALWSAPIGPTRRALAGLVVAAALAGFPAVAPSSAAVAPVGASVAIASQQSLVGGAVWSWPLAPPIAIVRPYLAPPTPYGAGHRGIDLAAEPGTEVRAPDDGVVHFAGVVVDRPVLSIRHAGGVLSSFEPVEAHVAAGEFVQRGEVLGTVQAGHSGTPSMHLGARVDGEYVNPLLFLGGLPHSVLMPTRALP